MKLCYLLLPFTLFLQACSLSPTQAENTYQDNYEHTRRYLDWMIPHEVQRNGIEAMSVLVLDRDQVLYDKSVGYASKEMDIMASSDTAYRVGSISKLFTATAIMQLQNEGKLDIDAPLSRYLPGFSIKSSGSLEGVTLRKMMSHHSGLPSDHLHGFKSYKANETLLDELREEYVSYAPDTVHSYSNLAYNLLGRVIENVSGLSYSDYLQQRIFQPLNMQHAGVGVAKKDYMARAYSDGELMSFPEIRDVAAGDVTASANDLARFAQLVLSNEGSVNDAVIPKSTLTEMLSPQNRHIPLDEGQDMGLGWFLHYPGEALYGMPELVWHDGSTFYFNASLLIQREAGLAVIVLSNSEESVMAVSKVAQQAMLLAVESKTGYQHSFPEPATDSVPSVSPDALVLWPGRYLSNELGEILIREKTGQLYADVAGVSVRLEPMEDGSFGVKYKAFGFVPTSIKELERMRLELTRVQGSQVIRLRHGAVIAQKVDDMDLSTMWLDRLGEYRHLNPDEMGEIHLTLEEDDGGLLALVEYEDESDNEQYFIPVSESRAVGIGYGRSGGVSAQFYMENGKQQFRYSGMLFELIEE